MVLVEHDSEGVSKDRWTNFKLPFDFLIVAGKCASLDPFTVGVVLPGLAVVGRELELHSFDGPVLAAAISSLLKSHLRDLVHASIRHD